MEKLSEFYVTKYALSGGIERRTLRVHENGRNVFSFDSGQHVWCVLGRDAFEKYDDAVADAERRRQKKVASMRKQIERLERLTFPTSPP